MLRGTPARVDRDVISGPRGSLRELLTALRCGTRIAVAVGLLACFGWQGLSAQDAPRKLIVRRSTRAIPHKFTVHPSEVTVAVNQAQHFEVTDAQGKPVAVHWNVSGIGCAGLECGTIDDQGNYHTPSSLPQPRMVTLEGVLVSDPNYSVLTEVMLEDAAATVSPAPVQVATGKKQEMAAPEVGRELLASNAELPPPPKVVAAAPSVGRQNLARSAALPTLSVIAPAPAVVRQNLAGKAESLPLPNVVAAAPSVGRQDLARGAEWPPLPNVVTAAPAVETRTIARNSELPPPSVIAAPPSVGRQNLARNTELPPSSVIAAAPTLGRQNGVRSAELPPPPKVVTAAPKVETQMLARNTELPPPSVVAAAPTLGKQNVARSASPPPPKVVAASPAVETQILIRSTDLLPPSVVAAAPSVGRQSLAHGADLPSASAVAPPPRVEKQNLVRSAELPAQPIVVASLSPITPQVPAGKPPQLAGPMAARQNAAASALLSPMPDVAAAVPAGTAVTYRDGQLTIHAENVTLAAVLKLISEQTGAVIDVPPGTGLEHVFEHTGPAPANNVLEQLLNGSPFNFIIVSSPQNPNQPAQVLLSLHAPDTDAPNVAAVQPSTASSSALWKPPDTAPPAAVLPYALDGRNLQPPKEQLSPEAIGEMMKERGRQLREQLQKQQ
jgi:hypothetical protein